MTKLLAHIEEMRARLKEVADNEQSLVKALGDALDRLDQALLRDVRTIASAHEDRREAILGELQGLASGIGMFRAPLAGLRPRSCRATCPRPNTCRAIAPGDWRRATSNIEDELDFGPHLNGAPLTGPVTLEHRWGRTRGWRHCWLLASWKRSPF